jgi:thioester reductase-like protein
MTRHTSNQRTVVVTGATGYLGSEITARLLERDQRSILCIARAGSADDALRRVREAVSGALGRDLRPCELSRLRCVRGNIETAYFGLAPSVHDSLAAQVQEIYHCAASTRLDRTLRDARRANVRGVQTVHALAAQAATHGAFRRLHHVSTAFVSGKVSGSVSAVPVSCDDKHARYRNTYEQTKAEAEQWLASRSIVPTTVYRPALIVGNSRNGRTTSWTAVHFAINLMASQWLRFTPGNASSRLDCVPGDFVADAILALGSRDEANGEIYHIVSGGRALSVHQLVEFVHAGISAHRPDVSRPATRILGPIQWRLRSLACTGLLTGRRRRALQKYRECEPYTRLDCVFENERECCVLAESGVSLPDPRTFFPHTVDYALQKNEFLRAAERTGSIALGTAFAWVRWPKMADRLV